MKTWTPAKIRELKGQRRFATLTCYDSTCAHWVDAAKIPLVLIGDSLGHTMMGYDSTVPVTMDDMVHHTKCVARAVKEALVVADLPFMGWQISETDAMRNSARLIQEGGADAVKIEGGVACAPIVAKLVAAGIPVVGHVGLTPQSVLTLGGYKVQGRTPTGAEQLEADVLAVAEAGAFAIVVECVPASLGARLTQICPVPIIGIGAGSACDGQILVLQDMLGMTPGRTAKFVKRYADLGATMQKAFETYAAEVEAGAYPSEEFSYQ